MTTPPTTDALEQAVRETIGLLNSIILCDEDHSDRSRAQVTAGLDALTTLAERVREVDDAVSDRDYYRTLWRGIRAVVRESSIPMLDSDVACWIQEEFEKKNQHIDLVTAERDTLRQQLATAERERDTVQAKLIVLSRPGAP